ncbi:MAG: Prophage regulatory [Schlesneria sp.]|nr:Prophage regulatory [Schlesneria sp.]
MSASPTPVLMTAKDLAVSLQISLRQLWRLRNAGQLPEPVALGRLVRWRTDQIQQWIAAGCPERSISVSDIAVPQS